MLPLTCAQSDSNVDSDNRATTNIWTISSPTLRTFDCLWAETNELTLTLGPILKLFDEIKRLMRYW